MVIRIPSPSMTNACRRAMPSSSSASVIAFVRSAPCTRMPKTSPPTRASTSVFRSRPRISSASPASTSSPAADPSASLTYLKLSMPSAITLAAAAVARRVVDVPRQGVLEADPVERARSGSPARPSGAAGPPRACGRGCRAPIAASERTCPTRTSLRRAPSRRPSRRAAARRPPAARPGLELLAVSKAAAAAPRTRRRTAPRAGWAAPCPRGRRSGGRRGARPQRSRTR